MWAGFKLSWKHIPISEYDHHPPLARCQAAIPEYFAEEFSGRWHGSSSRSVWASVSFIAVSAALQTGRLLWHIEFSFFIAST